MTLLSELWDTTRMRLLVEIERGGSLSAAARAVGIGQPSASQHLRDPRSRRRTATGRAEWPRQQTDRGRSRTRGARGAGLGDALCWRARAQRACRSTDRHRRLGASTAPGSYLLPPTRSAASRRDYPNVDVEIGIAASGEILRRLLAGRVEIAIVGVDKADERIALEPFLADEIVGVSETQASFRRRKGTMKPKALAELTLLCREPDSSSRAFVEAELLEIGIQPARIWELGSTEAVQRASREGLGIAFLSSYAVAEEIDRRELDVFRLRGRPRLTRDLQVARIAEPPVSPAETAFVATLTRCCAKQATYAKACVSGSCVTLAPEVGGKPACPSISSSAGYCDGRYT